MRMDLSLREKRALSGCRLDVCRGACCTGGIWVDLLHVQRILAESSTIQPWMAERYRQPVDKWFGDEEMEHDDFPSGVGIPTAVGPRDGDPQRQGCIFVRDDHLCSLQLASDALGLAWPGLKPFDCATFPVLRSEGELLIDHESLEPLAALGCLADEDIPARPWHSVFRAEVELAIGKEGYATLAWETAADAAGDAMGDSYVCGNAGTAKGEAST